MKNNNNLYDTGTLIMLLFWDTDLKDHENASVPEVSFVGVVLHVAQPPQDL